MIMVNIQLQTFLLLLFSLSISVLGHFSSESNDFYIAFPKSRFKREVLSVYISNSRSNTVLALLTSKRSFNRLISIPPGTTFTVEPPTSFEVRSSADYNKGIRVHTILKTWTLSVAVMKHAQINSLSAGYLAQPPSVYPGLKEYVYYTGSYQWDNRVLTNYSSIILVVGTQANTSIVITPTREVQIPEHFRNPSYNWSTVEAGDSYTIKINAMETAHFENYLDLTGSKLTSDKPLVVIGAHECTDVPVGVGFCDSLAEQFPPTVTWGRFFLVTALYSRLTGERFRIIAKKGTTVVRVKCVNSSLPEFGHVTLILNETGKMREFELGESRYCSITANKPVLVIQYSLGYAMDEIGDPFMAVIAPVEQYKEGPIMVKSPRAFKNHVTITVSSEHYSSGKGIFINDTTVGNWSPIYCGRSFVCGYAARQSVSTGTHRVRHVNPEARFFVLSYGFEYHDGYGSSAGMYLNQIADICEHGEVRLKSEQDSAETIAGTQEEGQVELCLGGVWSKLCAHSGWGTQEASVVCRQTLGPGNAVGAIGSFMQQIRNVSWQFTIADLQCVGSESKLTECSWSSDNVIDEVPVCPLATVKCYPKMNISVSLSPESSQPHLVRTPASLECMANISPPMSTDLSLELKWKRNKQRLQHYSSNDTYHIQPPMEMKKNSAAPPRSWFMSRLSIPSLRMEDAVMYECMAVLVMTQTGVPLVLPVLTWVNLNVTEVQSVIFQLKLGGVGHCSNWLLQYESPVDKGKGVKRQVAKIIMEACANCTFTDHHIAESVFRCFDQDSNYVTFRAKMYDTEEGSLLSMVAVLEDWVAGGPVLAVKGTAVVVDPSCVVVIQSFADAECVGASDILIDTTGVSISTSAATTVKNTDKKPEITPHSPEISHPNSTSTTTQDDLENKHQCLSSNDTDHSVMGTQPYIIAAVTLLPTVLVVALATIFIILICIRHTHKKSDDHGNDTPLTSFDDPVEGRIQIEAAHTDSFRSSKEPSLKHKIVQMFSTEDPLESTESQNPSLKQEIMEMFSSKDSLGSTKSQDPSLKEEIMEMFSSEETLESISSQDPSLMSNVDTLSSSSLATPRISAMAEVLPHPDFKNDSKVQQLEIDISDGKTSSLSLSY